jgi:mannose-6-phosphate isomerase
MNQPLCFEPLAMERVWGGRELEKLFGKVLPPGGPVGESWEVVDREEAQSVVVGGEWAGHTLHDLWTNHREGIFGEVYGGHPAERFPLLIKLLDARETLSVQVHPPVEKAAELGGEPKTEMWYFLEAGEEACIYAGVSEGVEREAFARLLEEGRVEEALPRLPVRKGESIFIPSGRLHAIGADTVIAEIQQNSDTTYRVYDWNRLGLDGKPRELHVEQSLRSIDFSDHAPALQPVGTQVVADCPYFRVAKGEAARSLPRALAKQFVIWGILEGRLRCGEREAGPGTFWLLPVGMTEPVEVLAGTGEVLEITLPVWE